MLKTARVCSSFWCWLEGDTQFYSNYLDFASKAKFQSKTQVRYISKVHLEYLSTEAGDKVKDFQ